MCVCVCIIVFILVNFHTNAIKNNCGLRLLLITCLLSIVKGNTDQIFSLLNQLATIDKNTSLVYIKGIAIRIERIKKVKQCNDV